MRRADATGWVVGLVIIAFGVVWLLNNLDVTDIRAGTLWRLWPLVIVFLGGSSLVAGLRQQPRHLNTLVVNLVVVAAGFLLLSGNLGWLRFEVSTVFGILIPLIVILLGLSMLGLHPGRGGSIQCAVMSGLELGTRQAFDLRDSTLVAFMGGITIDLSNARPSASEISLECVAIMGGIEIKVPRGWRVDFDGTAILGGVKACGEGTGGIVGHKQVHLAGDDGPAVAIGARAVMGGIEVRVVDPK